MLPLSVFMHSFAPPVPKNLQIHSTAQAFFVLDLNTNILYGATFSANFIGLAGTAKVPKFVQCSTNVKRVFGQNRNSSGTAFYQSLDNKIFVTGTTTITTGTTGNYTGWTDITAMFNTAGITDIDTIKDITCFGEYKINVVLHDGTLFCSGNNNSTSTFGTAFGDGTNTSSFGAFVKITAIQDVSVACGNYYLKKDGTLYCTGNNSFGQLGDNTTTSINTIKLLYSNVQDVKAGYNGYYFVLQNGTLYGGGKQLNRLSGDEFAAGNSAVQTFWKVPTVIRTNVKAVHTGYSTPAVYVDTDTGLYSSGQNAFGQLGVGTTTAVFTLTKMLDPQLNLQFCRSSQGTLVGISDKLWYCGYLGAVLPGSGNKTVLTEVPIDFL